MFKYYAKLPEFERRMKAHPAVTGFALNHFLRQGSCMVFWKGRLSQVYVSWDTAELEGYEDMSKFEVWSEGSGAETLSKTALAGLWPVD